MYATPNNLWVMDFSVFLDVCATTAVSQPYLQMMAHEPDNIITNITSPSQLDIFSMAWPYNIYMQLAVFMTI